MPRLGDRQPYAGPDTDLLLLGREPGPDGAYGRPAPGAPLPRDPNDPSLWLPGQGRANACGTTTLAYVLRYLLGPSLGKLAVVPGLLGLVVPAAQTVAGAAVLLGAAALARLRGQ